jgi:soluble lytic murein transglycosylase-like protein
MPTSVSNAMLPTRSPAEHAYEQKVARVLSEIGPRLTKSEPDEHRRVAETIIHECDKTGFDPLFVLAVIESESNYDIEAVSSSGARGLMQILPSTWRDVSKAKRMFDPVENVRAGIRYLHFLSKSGFRRPESILLAYNQGPLVSAQVSKFGFEPPDEGKHYVPRVMDRYKKLLVKHGFKIKDARKLFLQGPSVV